jgi:hypothetical protein
MTKILLTLIALPGLVLAQISGTGQVGCTAAPVTGTGWTTSTTVNTTQILAANVAGAQVLVTLDQGSTLTVGAVTFQGDAGDGNFVTLASWQVIDSTTAPFATIANPYTLAASTNKQFLVLMGGMYRLQLKLSTAITGTATVTPYTTISCYQLPLAFQATAANLNMTGSVTFASPQAVTGTFWQTTQPVSGTVTSDLKGNAGAAVDQAVGSTVPANAVMAGYTDGTNTQFAYLDPCQRGAKTYTVISQASSSATTLVAGTSSKKTYVCSIFISPLAAAVNISIVEGTGTNCSSVSAGLFGGTTAANGANIALNGGFVYGTGASAIGVTATAADNLCILDSSSGQVSGNIVTVQY